MTHAKALHFPRRQCRSGTERAAPYLRREMPIYQFSFRRPSQPLHRPHPHRLWPKTIFSLRSSFSRFYRHPRMPCIVGSERGHSMRCRNGEYKFARTPHISPFSPSKQHRYIATRVIDVRHKFRLPCLLLRPLSLGPTHTRGFSSGVRHLAFRGTSTRQSYLVTAREPLEGEYIRPGARATPLN